MEIKHGKSGGQQVGGAGGGERGGGRDLQGEKTREERDAELASCSTRRCRWTIETHGAWAAGEAGLYCGFGA